MADPVPGKTVVIAVEGEATAEVLQEVLSGAGYRPEIARTGREALGLLERKQAGLALVDVGLPDLFGFQICEIIRKSDRLKGVKIILIGTIYHPGRYRRPPDTLFGADDYIERHQIQESLLEKIHRLMGPPSQQTSGASEAPPPAPQKQPLAAPARASAAALSPVERAAHEAAQRLARIIISDIVLYNQPAANDSIRSGTFRETLAEALAEGRKLYDERTSQAVRDAVDYFEQEIDRFLSQKRVVQTQS